VVQLPHPSQGLAQSFESADCRDCHVLILERLAAAAKRTDFVPRGKAVFPSRDVLLVESRRDDPGLAETSEL
jgi:hypothetical protein